MTDSESHYSFGPRRCHQPRCEHQTSWPGHSWDSHHIFSTCFIFCKIPASFVNPCPRLTLRRFSEACADCATADILSLRLFAIENPRLRAPVNWRNLQIYSRGPDHLSPQFQFIDGTTIALLTPLFPETFRLCFRCRNPQIGQDSADNKEPQSPRASSKVCAIPA
jgi:hypothetical protein